jgi:hypothetical protein
LSVHPSEETLPVSLPDFASESGEQRTASNRLAIWLLWAGVASLALYGFFSPNGLLTSFAIIVLPVVVKLLWVRGEPPVLVFACVMQWLQASAAIFYTNLSHVSLTQTFGTPQLEEASWLSLIAILVLAAGMRVLLIRRPPNRHPVVAAAASKINLGRAFLAYLVSSLLGTQLSNYAGAVSGITQLLVALAALKWVFVYVLAYCVLEQRRGFLLLTLLVVLEVAVGLLAYFAGFKSVFFIVAVAALASPLALGGRRLAILLATIVCLFSFGVFWSAIKTEYRDYLNQGTGQQTVTVPMEDRAMKLGEMVDRFTWNDFEFGIEAMVLRVSYVYYFALAMTNVPDSVPYENGALWWGTLKHTFMPRLFFPNKPTLDDSERTMLYTGIMVSGAEQGTSIGIGYVGESYIDFGPVGMFGPIFLLGCFYGGIYRVFALHSRYALLGNAVAAAILVFGAYTIETSNIKLVGTNVTAALVLGGFYLLLGGRVQRWLMQ